MRGRLGASISDVPELPPIFADFQNSDSLGRLRLNTLGSLRDLAALDGGPREGMSARIECAELSTIGVVTFSADELVWVAVIDWSAVVERTD